MKNKLKDNLFAVITSVAIIVAVVLVNVVLYSLTSINGWYVAYAEDLDLTISGNTDKLFEEARAKGRRVDIIFCMPEDELKVHSTGKDVLTTAKQFEERYPDFINLKFYNIGTMQDENNEITDFKKYQTNELGEEIKLHRGSVIFSSTVKVGEDEREDFTVLNSTTQNGVAFLDFYHIDADGYVTAYNGEETFASRILWTLADEHKIAYFTTGHGETVDITLVNMITSAGYYFKTLDLVRTDLYNSSAIENPEELKNKKGLDLDRAGFVIISNPTTDFAKGTEGLRTEIDKLEQYLDLGGSLYVTLDPYVGHLSNLDGLLAKYGMQLSSSETSEGKTVRSIIKDSQNAITTDGYTFVANYADGELGERLSKKTGELVPDDVVVKNAGEITLSGTAKPVLVASSAAEKLADGEKVDGKGGYCVAALSEVARADGKTTRVYLVSGVYLTASDAVLSDSYANRNYTYAVLDEFFGSSVAPYGCKLVPYNTGLLEDLTMGSARVYTALIMAVPVALAVVGVVINKRRKNR